MATTASVCDVRLHWCRWFHCESSFNLSLVPDAPGLFAVAEEDHAQKRLNVVKIEAADNLFHALNQLFTQDCPLRAELEHGRCYLRYAVMADAAERGAAVAALQKWLAAPDACRSPLVTDFLANGSDHPYRDKED